MANGRSRLDHRNRSSHLDENNDRGRQRDGDHGVDRDAKRAMIRIAFQGMNVGDLHDGEQSQEHKAHHRGGHEGSRRPPVPMLFYALCQQNDPLP